MRRNTSTAYIEHPDPEKLSQLRAKTDRQLLNLIRSDIEVASHFAALAEQEHSAGNRASAEESLGRAEQAVTEVQKLLPVLCEAQRRVLAPNLNELREALDRMGRLREVPRTRTASFSW